jgi:hypothetical protein
MAGALNHHHPLAEPSHVAQRECAEGIPLASRAALGLRVGRQPFRASPMAHAIEPEAATSGHRDLIGQPGSSGRVHSRRAFKRGGALWVDDGGQAEVDRSDRVKDQPLNLRSPARSFHPSRLRSRGNR